MIPSPVSDAYEAWRGREQPADHASGTLSFDALRAIEQHLPSRVRFSAETGCGKSTILFSNVAEHHTVFCVDDRARDGSSVAYFETCPLTKADHIVTVFGPTQRTLPQYDHLHEYDVVLLDGPHGWPFPELEYYAFYPHIATGGLLIVDDCNIPTIGRMADILAEDDMWELEDVSGVTAIFRRTAAALFSPEQDGWWKQNYNRRRIAPERTDLFLASDSEPKDRITPLELDKNLFRSKM